MSQPVNVSGVPAWFVRVGLPLTMQDQAGIAAMLRNFEAAPGTPIVAAASWWDAARIIRAEDSDNRWWDAEEAERERLWSAAAERLTEGELLARLTDVAAALGDSIRNSAALAAARAGVADPAVIRAAADAAMLALHQQALAELAGAVAEHYFRSKFALFAAGRWPLGIFAREYVVF